MAPIVEVEGLVVEYGGPRGLRKSAGVRAVSGVSFEVEAREFVGLVGESGSGKSSIANAILGFAPVSVGHVRLGGVDLTTVRGRAARQARRRAQLVMQDPFEALDPHMTVGKIVEEPLIVHGLGDTRQSRKERTRATLESVGLAPASEFWHRRPHELSGGQRQRVCVAACLVVEPAILIADEPVSMLDVSVRASILHLLDGLRIANNMSVLMITHDLPTAAAFCDRLLVMHDGVIVEAGPPSKVISDPEHPYTRELLAATPRLRRAGGQPAHVRSHGGERAMLPTTLRDRGS